MKNEIKVLYNYVVRDPDTYEVYKDETKEYIGKITNKSVMVDMGGKKPLRISIEKIVDGSWYVKGYSGSFKISKENLEYLKKLHNTRKRIEEIENESKELITLGEINKLSKVYYFKMHKFYISVHKWSGSNRYFKAIEAKIKIRPLMNYKGVMGHCANESTFDKNEFMTKAKEFI